MDTGSEPPTWIALLGQACLLIVELYLDSGLIVNRTWEKNCEYLFYQDSEYLQIELQTAEGKILAVYEFIPWIACSLRASLTRQLVTVSEDAVVYRKFETVQKSEEEQSLSKRFDHELMKILDYNILQKSADIPLKWPDDIRVISCKAHPSYIEAQIAVPGSRAVLPAE